MVDISPTIVAVLTRLPDIRRAEAAVQGAVTRWFFFGDTPEMVITPETARLYDLTYTYVTLAVAAGVVLLTVSRPLGHTAITTNADMHTHAVLGGSRTAAHALAAALAGNRTQSPRNLPDRPLVISGHLSVGDWAETEGWRRRRGGFL
jgi:hypothetical protein